MRRYAISRIDGDDDFDTEIEDVAHMWLLIEESKVAQQALEEARNRNLAIALMDGIAPQEAYKADYRRKLERVKTLTRLMEEEPTRGAVN